MSAITQQPVKSYSKLFIGGHWVTPSTSRMIDVVSPVTEELIAQVPEASEADIDAAVAAAREAFDEGPWPRMPPAERAAVLRRIGAELDRAHRGDARRSSRPRSAPRSTQRAPSTSAHAMWDDAAARRVLRLRGERAARRRPGDDHPRAGRRRRARSSPGTRRSRPPRSRSAPALAAGCTVVLKPAPEGPVSAMCSPRRSRPPGCRRAWSASSRPAARSASTWSRHPDVDKIAFTGSTAAGRRIMSLCGERIARVTLELGGKSAAIVADDIALDGFSPTSSSPASGTRARSARR